MKKITKTVYVVDGREYDDEAAAIAVARAKRVESLLSAWADANHLPQLFDIRRDLSHVIVQQWHALQAAVEVPVSVEDADFEAENDANEAPRGKRKNGSCPTCGAPRGRAHWINCTETGIV